MIASKKKSLPLTDKLYNYCYLNRNELGFLFAGFYFKYDVANYGKKQCYI